MILSPKANQSFFVIFLLCAYPLDEAYAQQPALFRIEGAVDSRCGVFTPPEHTSVRVPDIYKDGVVYCIYSGEGLIMNDVNGVEYEHVIGFAKSPLCIFTSIVTCSYVAGLKAEMAPTYEWSERTRPWLECSWWHVARDDDDITYAGSRSELLVEFWKSCKKAISNQGE